MSKGPAEDEIRAVCQELADMLCEKNRKYGNSALEPIRVASKASAIEQILVRIDDKIARWKNLQPDDAEDVVLDLMGYLVLLRVAERRPQKPALRSSWSEGHGD
jgi:hypothetical protein